MSKEDTKTDLISLSEDSVSEDFQSSQSIVTTAVKEDLSCADLVASKSSVGEALALDETTSGSENNADNHNTRESIHSPSNKQTEESSDASIPSSANEASGDSGTSFVKRNRKVSFATRVSGDFGETSAAGASSAGEAEDRREISTETANYRCCPEYLGPIGYFRIKIMLFRESKYLLLLQIALLCLPITSGFIGAKNMYKCPASPAVAILFFMMGVIGTVFLCGRIYGSFKRALFPDSGWTDPSDGLPIAGFLLLGVLFATELGCFFNMDPDFSPARSNHKFCDAKFYNFAEWMNYSGIGLIIFLLVLHCPGLHLCSGTNVPQAHVTHQLIGGLD